MRYNYVIDRIRKVIISCKTDDQIEIAEKYVEMIICKYSCLRHKQRHSSDFDAYVKIRDRVGVLRKWVRVMLFSQKTAIMVNPEK